MKKIFCWFSVVYTFLLFVLASACVDKNSDNPYDDIERPDDGTDTAQPYDTATIAGLHKFIFKEKCAIPSCHGGTFEPDFRTPQSAFSTMVWHPVIKNTDDYRFRFRVVPFDVNASWLHERLISDDPILGRMPRYADPLSDREMFYIKKWIQRGAPDLDGKVAEQPDLNVTIWGYGVWGDGFPDEISQNRPEWAAPFSAPDNTTCWFVPYLEDESTLVKNFKKVRLKLSTDPNNFNNALIFNCQYDAMYDNWVATVETGTLENDVVYYLRFTAQDDSHTTPNELPNPNSSNYILKNFSFRVQ